MTNHLHSHAVGAIVPASDTAHVAIAGRAEEHQGIECQDFQAIGIAEQAALTIDGEDYARAWLDRVCAGTAQPGELAVILAFLHGEMLNGACRLIEKALEGRHHA